MKEILARRPPPRGGRVPAVLRRIPLGGDRARGPEHVSARVEPLHGDVEVDDTWIGGPQAGLRGSRQLKGRRAALVLVADLIGQNWLGARYPVGVVTGVLGAPFLLYLLIRTHRAGGSL